MSNDSDVTLYEPIPQPTFTASSPMIYPAIIAIMREVGPIAKSERNTQQNFDYRGIDRIYNAVHPLFAKNGVFSTSTIITSEHRSGTNSKGTAFIHAFLSIRFTYYAADGSHVESEVVGEGIDYSGDKASNKAMSTADKYAILQILKIPTAMVDSNANQNDNPAADEKAPKTPPRDERKKAEVKVEVNPKEITEVSSAWKQAFGTDDPAKDKVAFVDWLKKHIGDVDLSKVGSWTRDILNKCRGLLGLPKDGDLQ